MVDKDYCMSSFLTFRYVVDNKITFKEGINRPIYSLPEKEYKIKTSDDIDYVIQKEICPIVDEKTAIMLSGGMDSAILATYLPEGTKAYTLECQAEGAVKETKEAKYYADICKLDHRVVDITWEDYLEYTPICMKQKGAPVHSIEPMIYKAALQAKVDGCTKLLFGELADLKFGGMDGLLAKDWTKDEFKKRFTYVEPETVLKNHRNINEPFEIYDKANYYNTYEFTNEIYLFEAYQSFSNACKLSGTEYVTPFVYMYLDIPLDLNRIRNGESKYLIRELFEKRYPGLKPLKKMPMPRAVGIWLKDWKGPIRDEFLPNCIEGLSGDQKWYVYVLEWFLNLIEGNTS